MRIQHNIMAMNAYRNYNNNTSALSKNLEKLSSGYKINRAGDDAAGLAISEKMRAQITGLDAAQKNVKDGISLVKTAEGAMQEIQDMLNRMDYLATQSANGTYDNDVDRAALQKEVNQLKAEINRIADSANFNGIKLLDGSLDSSAVTAATTTAVGKLPDVGEILGKDTVLHKGLNTPSDPTTFSVDLHNLEISGEKGKEFTISIGDTKLTGTLQKDGALSASDIADALGNGTDTLVKFTYEDGSDYNNDQVTFGEEESYFTASGTGTRVTFTHDGASPEIAPDMKVSIEAGSATATKVGNVTVDVIGKDATGKTKGVFTGTATPTALTLANAKANNKYNVTVAGITVNDLTLADGEDADALIGKWKDAVEAKGAAAGLTVTLENSGADVKFSVAGSATMDTLAKANQALVDAGITGITLTGSDTTTGTYDYTAAGAVTTAKTNNAGFADAATTNAYTVTIDGKDYDDITATLTSTDATLAQGWAAKANADADVTAKFSVTANADGTITLTSKVKGTDATATYGETEAKAILSTGTWAPGTDIDATTAKSTIDFTGKTGADVWGGTVTIGTGADAVTYKFVQDAVDADPASETAVVVANDDDAAAIATALFAANKNDAAKVTVAAANGKVTVTAADAGEDGNDLVKIAASRAGADPKIKGDYNVSTTVIAKKGDDGAYRLASTYFDLTKEMAADGAKIQIGKEEYTFTTNEADVGTKGMVYIGDLDTKSKGYMTDVAERLTEAAKDNQVYTVGHDGERMTFTENEAWDNGDKDAFDLTTKEGVEKSFGFTSAGKEKDEGRSLTLQIGDTSDSYNQLKVNVGDMHVTAMGIADIDISTQDGAAAAVQTIKDAINYVSGVRGDLGAIQNRLDHTANNLSVMAENIQDAESTIRDTDVAAEMMSYVKNNILVQSAQAMLAQANQVPQGVLQLLG